MSGERGIIGRAESQLLVSTWFVMQAIQRQRFAAFWLLLVLSGCCGLFGIGFSTLSAQSENQPLHGPPSEASMLARPQSRRRGRQGQTRNSEGEDGSDSSDIAASYARYSSGMQREESTVDQHRKNQELAAKNGHRVPPDLQFSDEAISGTTLRRVALDAMLRAAEAGEFKTLYLYSLSRLARESVITMPMLKKLVYTFGVRVICVSEGLDSDRNDWEILAAIMAVIHERYLKELSESVHRGQEGMVLAGYSVGDHCFGYDSVPAPGEESRQIGKNQRVRKIYQINSTEAEWVHKIFHWFTNEKRSIRWIVKELNRLKAPKDHRSSKPEWEHGLVIDKLSNEKYIGIWPWGQRRNVRDPFTGNKSQTLRPEGECEQWVRTFEHLQIIDDETFRAAQQRLKENEDAHAKYRDKQGRLRGSTPGSNGKSPRHLLQGLFKCGKCRRSGHDTVLRVGGAGGRYLGCPRYQRGTCKCRARLQRKRVEQMLLEFVGREILGDEVWFEAVWEHLNKSIVEMQNRVPTEIAALQRQIGDIERRIARLVDRVEAGVDSPEIARRLSDRRDERRDLSRKLRDLDLSHSFAASRPTKAWLRQQLSQLGDVLRDGGPAAAKALRDLVGGEIVVEEVEHPNRKRRLLRGTFRIAADGLSRSLGLHAVCNSGPGETGKLITIDFVDPDPSIAQREQAKALYDEGLMMVEIAQRLNVSKSRATAVIKDWFKSNGQPMPDGRSRLKLLQKKQLELPRFQVIAQRAYELWVSGLSLRAIARDPVVKSTDNTVQKALEYWCREHGLPVPTVETRRKQWVAQAVDWTESGVPLTEVAKRLQKSVPTVRAWLQQWYTSKGANRPDLRRRRSA